MKQITNKKLWFCLGILAAILLVFARFGLYFWKIGGFSGLSILLPVLLFCAIVSGICTSAFYGAWVYRDCEKRGDDPLLCRGFGRHAIYRTVDLFPAPSGNQKDLPGLRMEDSA